MLKFEAPSSGLPEWYKEFQKNVECFIPFSLYLSITWFLLGSVPKVIARIIIKVNVKPIWFSKNYYSFLSIV